MGIIFILNDNRCIPDTVMLENRFSECLANFSVGEITRIAPSLFIASSRRSGG